MNNDILGQDIRDLLGLDELPEEEKARIIEETGSLIMEGAVLRFLAEHTEEDNAAFEQYVAAHAENEDVIQRLVEAYPDFGDDLEAEVAAFKADTIKVLGQG